MGAFDDYSVVTPPLIDRSTGAMPGQHSRNKSKSELLKKYHESNSDTPSREVTVRYLDEDETITEKISDESPLGIATLNRRPGEIVQVNGPKGVYEVEILKME